MGVQEINSEEYKCKEGGINNWDGEKLTIKSFKICVLHHI